MAETQKSMVSIIAIIAIVILVGAVIWFLREESDEGLDIEIGVSTNVPVLVAPSPILSRPIQG